MYKVEMYSRPGCGYCVYAKALLRARGITYEEIDLSLEQHRFSEMLHRTRRSSLPQIIINGQAIGGFDQLRRLDQSGELDVLLAKETE